MTEFALTYRTPPDYVGSPDALAVWDEWFDSLGPNLIDRATPCSCARRSATATPRPRSEATR
jgi:hypothetical protein